MRKVAIITLFQNLEDEKDPDIDELDKQIRHAIESSLLSKSWTVDRVTFLDDTITDLENDESKRYEAGMIREISEGRKGRNHPKDST